MIFGQIEVWTKSSLDKRSFGQNEIWTKCFGQTAFGQFVFGQLGCFAKVVLLKKFIEAYYLEKIEWNERLSTKLTLATKSFHLYHHQTLLYQNFQKNHSWALTLVCYLSKLHANKQ